MPIQIYVRKDGCYHHLVCSKCAKEINEKDWMDLASEWNVNQCYDCGKLGVFCSDKCNDEFWRKHLETCPPDENGDLERVEKNG